MIYYTVGSEGVPLAGAAACRTWGDARDEARRMLTQRAHRLEPRLEILKVTTALHGYVEREQPK